MTGRTAILAATSVTVAVIAITVRPFLHHAAPRHVVTIPALPSTTNYHVVVTTATAAARDALGCPSTNRQRRSMTAGERNSCGRLAITRRQISCATADSCNVELIGTLTSTGTVGVVALTVNLRGDGTRWDASAVTS